MLRARLEFGHLFKLDLVCLMNCGLFLFVKALARYLHLNLQDLLADQKFNSKAFCFIFQELGWNLEVASSSLMAAKSATSPSYHCLEESQMHCCFELSFRFARFSSRQLNE